MMESGVARIELSRPERTRTAERADETLVDNVVVFPREKVRQQTAGITEAVRPPRSIAVPSQEWQGVTVRLTDPIETSYFDVHWFSYASNLWASSLRSAETRAQASLFTNAIAPEDWGLVTSSFHAASEAIDYGVVVTAATAATNAIVVNANPYTAYRRSTVELANARDRVLNDLCRRLDALKSGFAQAPPQHTIASLAEDLGVSQLLLARATGVSATAVRKWRRGESARPEHRSRLSAFAALIQLLDQLGIHHAAAWLEMPISTQATITPLDFYMAGREDLLLLLAVRAGDPQAILDEFDPDWRTRFAPDPDYEVVALADGSRSAVPRREEGTD